jgi:hypothetical protein
MAATNDASRYVAAYSFAKRSQRPLRSKHAFALGTVMANWRVAFLAGGEGGRRSPERTIRAGRLRQPGTAIANWIIKPGDAFRLLAYDLPRCHLKIVFRPHRCDAKRAVPVVIDGSKLPEIDSLARIT